MIEREGLIIRTAGKRLLLLRDNSQERLNAGLPTANYRGTGFALVGITKKYESVENYINRINALKTWLNREAAKAVTESKKAAKEHGK